MTRHSPRQHLLATLMACLLGLAAPPPASAAAPPLGQLVPADPYGTLPGTFAVTGNGAATFDIPFDVPPGIGGVQPSLSLIYSSQEPNGLLGVGFVLQGLSSISRCKASKPLDGYNGTIGFDAYDRFCLDGQRLVLMDDNATYGATGTIYHTLKETWTRVEAVGSCGSGPCSFTATTKAGWTLTFEGQLRIPSGEMISWQLTGVSDLNGNTMSVGYQTDASSNQSVPSQIQYTSNATVGVKPLLTVTFQYQSRQDVMPTYVGGQYFATQQLLDSISTFADGTPVRTYKLVYGTSPNTGRALLTAVQLYAPNGTSTPGLVYQTTFAWTGGTDTLTPAGTAADGTMGKGICGGAGDEPTWADFNGDGLPDLACEADDGNATVAISNGETLAAAQTVGSPSWCPAGDRGASGWVDFNGDLLADLACSLDGGTQQVLVSNGSRLVTPNGSSSGEVEGGWCAADDSCDATYGNFSNDGRADLLCGCGTGTSSPSYMVLDSTGTGVESPNGDSDGTVLPNATADIGFCTLSGSYTFWSDFNADGMQDLFCFAKSAGIQVMVSTGTELASPNDSSRGSVSGGWCDGSGDHLNAADINADGNTDLHCRNDNGTHQIQLSTGSDLVYPANTINDGQVLTGWCTGSSAETDWGDYNGDGFPDLLCNAGGVQSVMLAQGYYGTLTLVPATSQNGGQVASGWCTQSDARVQFTDVNGDALQDITCSQTDGTQKGQLQSSPLPDLLQTVTNGIGGTTSVTYAPLTDSDVYTHGSGSESYPLVKVQTPLYVVESYTYSDGDDWSSTFVQGYTNLVFDVEHGLLLGFETMTSLEQNTGRKTVTTYDQTYPAQGYVTSTSVYGSDGAPLDSQQQTPLVVQTDGGPPYQILTANQTRQTFSNGDVAASTQQTYTYDAYGNVTLLSDLGDPNTGAQPVYTCTKYSNDLEAWRLGYPLQSKTTSTEDGCSTFLSSSTAKWNATTDLAWQSWSYDDDMQVVTQSSWDDVNADWVETSATYDPLGRMATMTDPAGNKTTLGYSYASLLATETTTTPATPNAGALTLVTVRDIRFGTVVAETDGNGNQARTVLDSIGRPVQSWGPDPDKGGVATLQLQAVSFAPATDGYCATTRARQSWSDGDTDDWLWSKTCVDGLARTKLTQQGGPGVQTVEQWQLYDGAGLVKQQSVPRYADATTTYWVITTYDERNRPITRVLPDGSSITWTYAEGGQAATTVTTTIVKGTADARSITHAYNVRGSLIQTTLANGGVTTYTLDPLQRMTNAVGPVGNQTTNTYNSLGQLTRQVSSDTGTTTLAYDTAARLSSGTDGAGHTVAYTYDSLNRVTTRTASRAGTQTVTTVYTYDQSDMPNGKGALTTLTRPDSVERFGYSAYGLVSAETLTLTDGTGTPLYNSPYQFANSYDPQGRPTGGTYPDGAVSQTTYDSLGNILTVGLQDVGTQSLETYATYAGYTALGQPGTLTLRNGLATSYAYHPMNTGLGALMTSTVAGQSAAAGAPPLLSLSYKWNKPGQVAGVAQTGSGVAALSNSYAYKSTGWLATVTGSEPATFDYDKAGNITLKDGVTYSYTPQTNQMATGSDGSAFQYAGDGALGAWAGPTGAWCYAYSSEARLQSVLTRQATGTAVCDDPSALTTVMAATYDARGQRLTRTDPDGTVNLYLSADYEERYTGGQVYTTKYLDGLEGRIVSITHQATVSTGTQGMLAPSPAGTGEGGAGSIVRAALTGWTGAAWAMLLAIAAGFAGLFVANRGYPATAFTRANRWLARLVPVVVTAMVLTSVPVEVRAELGSGGGYPVPVELYFHRDQVGSVVLTTDSSGAPVTRVGYQAFGAIDQDTSSGPDTFRQKFTAKELDEETNLVYFGARYYSPKLGRFIGPDPAGQFDSPYLYAANDPQTLVDPDGEFVFLIIIAISVIAGAYFGGEAVNHNYNPAAWNWKKGKTYAGVFAGAAIGAAGGALGATAAEAGFAAGVVGVGAAENVGFGLLAGDSPSQLGYDALIGGATAGLAEGAGAGLGALGSRLATRSAPELSEVGGEAAGAEEEGALDACAVTGSLHPETPVETEDGPRRIGELVAGDRVLAFDEATGRPRLARVDSVERVVMPVVRVRAGGTDLVVNESQPFAVAGKGWVAARDLSEGDRLLTMAGEAIAVDGVEAAPGDAEAGSVAIELAEFHTFAAGDMDVVVHNSACRLAALGRTPSKSSKTGRIVQNRYRAEERLRTRYGQTEVQVQVDREGNLAWRPFDRNIHMGHIRDAVEWWNTEGWQYGARSPQARTFMLDPNNYRFEWGPLNSSNGAGLRMTYREPARWTGPWPPR